VKLFSAASKPPLKVLGPNSFLQTFLLPNWEWCAVGLVVLLALRFPLAGDRLFLSIERGAKRLAVRKNLAITVLIVGLVGVRVAFLAFYPKPVPVFQDEFSYLLAGDTFLHGRLANPTHPFWIFFDTMHVLQNPTYSSMYPPAQGFILAIGDLLGHPWIGVVLSMAAFFAALLWMLQGWLPPAWAFLGAAVVFLKLGIFSYWMNSYWGGAVAAFAGALLIGSYPRLIRKPSLGYSIAMGAGVAILLNSRPYEGAVVCVPVAIALLVWLFRQREFDRRILLWRVVAPLAVLVVLTFGFILFYNSRVTRHPLLMPHALDDQQHISVSNFVWGPRHSERQYANHQFDGFYNHLIRNQYLRTWDDFIHITELKFRDFYQFFLGPALLIPVLALPWLFRDRRTRLLLIQFLCYCAGAIAVVFFHPHYAAPVIATFYALVTQLLRHVRHWKYRGRPVGIGLTRGAVLVLVTSFLINVATLAANPRSSKALGWGATGNWDRARVVSELEEIPGNHLVIVNYSHDHHNIHLEWVYNDADIDRSRVVWVRDIPGMNLQPLLDYFKDRNVWIISPDTPNPEPVRYTGQAQLLQLERLAGNTPKP
jgi:hypothetical protein